MKTRIVIFVSVIAFSIFVGANLPDSQQPPNCVPVTLELGE